MKITMSNNKTYDIQCANANDFKRKLQTAQGNGFFLETALGQLLNPNFIVAIEFEVTAPTETPFNPVVVVQRTEEEIRAEQLKVQPLTPVFEARAKANAESNAAFEAEISGKQTRKYNKK